MSLAYFAKEALRQSWRQRLLTLVAVSAMTLAALFAGSWALLWRNARHWQDSVGQAAQLSVYLKPGVTAPVQASVQAAALAVSGVASADLVTPEMAAQSLKSDPQIRDALALLGDENPFPALLKVRLSQADPASLKTVSARLKALDNVDEVDAGQGAVESLLKASGAVRTALLGLLGLFSAAALLIVAAVLRLAAWSRRQELGIMRLVGASHGFIRAPFLLEGLLEGLLAGGLAAAILAGSIAWLGARLSMDLQVDLAAFLPEGVDWSMAAALSGAAGLLGLAGAGLGLATVTLAYEDEEQG
jgi:cell division transport system permease protein